jgi:hypothetical protein
MFSAVDSYKYNIWIEDSATPHCRAHGSTFARPGQW